MRSLAEAARILRGCVDPESTAPLLAELGFASTLAPLGDDARETLGLSGISGEIRITRGIGAIRAIVVCAGPGEDTRSCLRILASRLGSRAPQLLWVAVALDSRAGEVGIAALDSTRAGGRASALVTKLSDVVDSDAETVCALAAVSRASDLLAHCRWLEILGRDSVSRRFYRELERLVAGLSESLTPRVAASDAAELALLCASRLLFLSFLETKGWLDHDHGFLGNRFADCMVSGGRFHQRVLNPLFFGTLNTRPSRRASRARGFGQIPFLNGGLFSRSALEARASNSFFTDEALGDLFGDLLLRYRFTAREDASTWSEAAVDPEMLGKAFESLMSASERRTTGAFFTPNALVRDVTRTALSETLAGHELPSGVVGSALAGATVDASSAAILRDRIARLRVLDPACGSGAFLVHALEELARLQVHLGDPRPSHEIRRSILTGSIYGVDLNPTAVWLCELRLWLSMAIEDPEPDPMRVSPLPNLDRNIRVGDSLAGDSFRTHRPLVAGSRVTRLRSRYSRATGMRKRSLARALDSLERACAIEAVDRRIAVLRHRRKELIVATRARDLFGNRPADPETMRRLEAVRAELESARAERRRLENRGALPFSFSSSFADAASSGGFDLVVGNPPWVRTHNLDARTRMALKDRFAVYRNSAWVAGSDAAAAGRGFASQADAAALFVERSADLLKPGGTAALILPVKLWRSLAGGGVRQLVMERMLLREIHDLTDAPQQFAAAVYPSVLVAAKPSPEAPKAQISRRIAMSAHVGGQPRKWAADLSRLPLDDSAGSPWLLIPADVRKAFDAFVSHGRSLARSSFGRPLLGVKTGCNNAFVVTAGTNVEPAILRPVAGGDQIARWSVGRATHNIIWTHDSAGPLRELPPRALSHLRTWRRELELRSDARGKHAWWSLFRTESADHSMTRVVWADIGLMPRAGILRQGDPTVPLNTCYVVRCRNGRDAVALAALINSLPVAAWLSVIAEPARGGYRRYMGWTMSLLPIPSDWERARRILAPIGEAALQGNIPLDADLLAATLEAYRLRREDIDALLEWTH